MSLVLLFHYLLLIMFRMLVHPYSGACDLLWIYFMCLYCSGSMCVGVTVRFSWGGVVSLWRLKHFSATPPQPNHTGTPTHIEPEQYKHMK